VNLHLLYLLCRLLVVYVNENDSKHNAQPEPSDQFNMSKTSGSRSPYIVSATILEGGPNSERVYSTDKQVIARIFIEASPRLKHTDLKLLGSQTLLWQAGLDHLLPTECTNVCGARQSYDLIFQLRQSRFPTCDLQLNLLGWTYTIQEIYLYSGPPETKGLDALAQALDKVKYKPT